MSLFDNDPLTRPAFSIFENKGVYAVLVGSGLSRAAEIPTGWEITLDLIRRHRVQAQGVLQQRLLGRPVHQAEVEQPLPHGGVHPAVRHPAHRR